MKNQKVWLVTGTSKGLGLKLTKHLLSLGHIVIATSRSTKVLETEIKEHRENLYPVMLDITSDQEVENKMQRSI